MIAPPFPHLHINKGPAFLTVGSRNISAYVLGLIVVSQFGGGFSNGVEYVTQGQGVGGSSQRHERTSGPSRHRHQVVRGFRNTDSISAPSSSSPQSPAAHEPAMHVLGPFPPLAPTPAATERMKFDSTSDLNGCPSTDFFDDFAQRVIQPRAFECPEAALIGLPGGDEQRQGRNNKSLSSPT